MMFLFLASCALIKPKVLLEFYYNQTKISFYQPSGLSSAVPVLQSENIIFRNEEQFSNFLGVILSKFMIDYGGGFLTQVDASQTLMVSLKKYSPSQSENANLSKIQLEYQSFIEENEKDNEMIIEKFSKENGYLCHSSKLDRTNYINCMRKVDDEVFINIISIYTVYVEDSHSYQKSVRQNMFDLVDSIIIETPSF
ncbi:MAG: hypothetical protein HWE27_06205 [Gammaproteobacteria bacterium]|nr:hypothetical protein [Gammaproteobacteria bacterium]